MKDSEFLPWLISMTTHIAELQRQQKGGESNAGPNFHDGMRTVTIEEEGFARWMGHRGEEEQAREINWPIDALRTERNERHIRDFKKLRDENEEFRTFLRSLSNELLRRLGSP